MENKKRIYECKRNGKRVLESFQEFKRENSVEVSLSEFLEKNLNYSRKDSEEILSVISKIK